MALEVIWYIIVGGMFTVYVILDGFDLGVGIVYPFVGRTDAHRDAMFESIGSVWDGNEVWLIAGGGALFCAFPLVYATSFSGFYLPLMILLWLLMFRGLAIELRHHYDDPVWRPLWGGAFFASSTLLSLTFGAALGNIVRGVPMDANYNFFEPLFTNFRVGTHTGILDWYTAMVGIEAMAALALHGACWLAMKTTDDLAVNARKLAGQLWWIVVAGAVLITFCTFAVQPQVAVNLRQYPWGAAIGLTAAAGLIAQKRFLGRANGEKNAFLASAVFLGAMMANAFFGIYPNILPARLPENSLTVWNAATSDYGLRVALIWWVPGILIATGYFIFVYSRMPRKFSGTPHE